MTDLCDDVVSGLLAGLQERGLSPFTINAYLAQLVCLADYAFCRSVICKTLGVRRLVEPRPEPNTLSQRQLECLVAAGRATRGNIGTIPASIFWPALILTLYDTAARIGSLLALRWGDVDFEAGTILLRAETGKLYCDSTKTLHASTLRVLRLLRDARQHGGDETKVFCWPLNYCYLWQKFREVTTRAGLPPGRRWKFHAIRRTTLTIVADAGGSWPLPSWPITPASR